MRERTATQSMAMADVYPQKDVAKWFSAKWPAAMFLKNMGRMAAMTDVAKAELAQSYMHQARIDFFRYGEINVS